MSQEVGLDFLGRVVIGEQTHPLTRVFILNSSPAHPAFIAVYIPVKKTTELALLAPITSWTKSRRPRVDPHVVTLTDDTTITIFSVSGCGCGSPLKKINYTLAVRDWDSQPTELPAVVDA